MKNLLLVIFIFSFNPFFAQVGIEKWRDHLPYSNGLHLAITDDEIFCATTHAIFSYNPETYEINRYSKINGLSDVGISDMAWNEDQKTLLIAYENSNIDIIKHDQIINVGDIKNSQIIGNKTINNITMKDHLAYLSCGFGVVVLDLAKIEVKETYMIESQNQIFVNDLDFFQNTLYAATTSGIFTATLTNPNLADFNAWSRLSTIDSTAEYNHIETFEGKIFVNKTTGQTFEDSIFYYDGSSWTFFREPEDNLNALVARDHFLSLTFDFAVDAYDNNLTKINHYSGYYAPAPKDAARDGNNIWIADKNYGLIFGWTDFNFNIINPGGPVKADVASLDSKGGHVWGVGGGLDVSWKNTYTLPLIYHFFEEKWNSYYLPVNPELDGHYDPVAVAVNPQDPTMAVVGTWSNDLFFIKGDTITVIDASNSTLNNPLGNRLAGITYDQEGNLWVMNSFSTNQVNLFKENKWYSFPLPGVQNEIGQTIRSAAGHLWIVLPRGKGLAAYNPGEDLTSPADDKTIVLNTSYKQGGLPSNEVQSVAEDLDGEIWVGTAKGIAVFYSPSTVFTSDIQDAQQIKLEQDNTIQLLLESEIVTAIAVDGANRKWLGTQNGGLFLMSPDGTKQVYHFTTENSPLISNYIKSLAIDHKSGEVFIGTDKGIVSFRSTATGAEENFTDVYAFPNPVRPEYTGPVAVKGLVRDAEVKITDVSGNLVYSGKALGGQIVWNGKRLDGSEVAAGVYLVFATNSDGTKTYQTKIMVIR